MFLETDYFHDSIQSCCARSLCFVKFRKITVFMKSSGPLYDLGIVHRAEKMLRVSRSPYPKWMPSMMMALITAAPSRNFLISVYSPECQKSEAA